MTICNGEIKLAQLRIVLSDVDDDGQFTINDALYLAHEAAYIGGAKAGYTAIDTDWGLMIAKLWGVENGGAYGYYVNNEIGFSLTDPISYGDYVSAYAFTDLTFFSDTYCYFDKNFVQAAPGDIVNLKLMMSGLDENWMPITLPVSGAVILLDGKVSANVTDQDGNVTFILGDETIISARSNERTLVPPVCVVKTYDIPVADFTLPDSTRIIEERAFQNDQAITVVDARHCMSIRKFAFKDCKGLTAILLPKNCDISNNAFDGCTAFSTIYAPEGGSTQEWANAHEVLLIPIPT